ncbi:MAG: heme exporter protein CcmB [Proteobacteria bacterium]|nr:heme exporter protein CcmB [Pseudomonadota bacterium]
MSNLTQYFQLMRHFFRQEFSALERMISPILFALVVLLVFTFTIPEVDDAWKLKMVVAQVVISSFFALQVSLSRSFEIESQDRFFEMIRVYPTRTTTFVLAKLSMVFFMATATFVSTVVLTSLLNSLDLLVWMRLPVMLEMVFVIGGLASLGTLLSAITLKAKARQVLFPLLFFPLSAPALIGASEALIDSLSNSNWTDNSRGWIVLSGAFFVILLTCALLLGGESLEAE